MPTESIVPAEAVGTGPECAELPNFGEGALGELADDTAGTAITNNLETSTLQQLLGECGTDSRRSTARTRSRCSLRSTGPSSS